MRAEVASLDEAQRTCEVCFSTGSDVVRYDWMSDKRYVERLAITPEAMRLERLNSGAPLLDTHSSYRLADQIGAVVPGSVRIEKGKAYATVKFSARAEVAPVLQDVKDGILRSVSVGYRIHRFEEETPKGNALPVRTATDWEPFEISMVSMPADIGAKVRKEEIVTNECVIVRRNATADADRDRRLQLAKARF